jgi:hypothetical protein
VRVTGGSLAAVGLAVVGLWHLSRGSAWLLERDCETAQHWMERGSAQWAVRNGIALGLGFMSRIGVVAWYLIPVACIAIGTPIAGAAVFGAYGATRGGAVWAWFLAMNLRLGLGQTDIAERLFNWYVPAKRLGAAVLTVTSTVAIVIVGF